MLKASRFHRPRWVRGRAFALFLVATLAWLGSNHEPASAQTTLPCRPNVALVKITGIRTLQPGLRYFEFIVSNYTSCASGDFYVKVDFRSGCGALFSGWGHVSAMAPYSSALAGVWIPSSCAGALAYTMYLDPFGSVAESNESDNVVSGIWTPPPVANPGPVWR